MIFPLMQALIINIPQPPDPPERIPGQVEDVHITCEQPCRVEYKMSEDKTHLEIVVIGNWVGFFTVPPKDGDKKEGP